MAAGHRGAARSVLEGRAPPCHAGAGWGISLHAAAPAQPKPTNGLQKPSQIMVDKAMSVKRERIGLAFGVLDDETMLSVTSSLAVFLGVV
jgi:hypothetical protein